MGEKIEKHCIRGLDRELWKEAKIQAIREGLTLGQYINKLLKEKLKPKP